jgi:cephalosporin hydroxylase
MPNISNLSKTLIETARKFFLESVKNNYSYNFEWLSRPIIQYPQDIVAFQEIVWKVKPDLIVETGIAHGGSLVLSASLLSLIDYCEALESGSLMDPKNPKRKVVGVDIDIRQHNRSALDSHPLRNRMVLIEGSSIEKDIINQVMKHEKNTKSVLVCLDSNHTHDHVLEELHAYAQLVTPGSYCIVFDTVIEDLPEELSANRSWGKGNSPKSAVKEFLASDNNFMIDKNIQDKLMLTVAPEGYLKRI